MAIRHISPWRIFLASACLAFIPMPIHAIKRHTVTFWDLVDLFKKPKQEAPVALPVIERQKLLKQQAYLIDLQQKSGKSTFLLKQMGLDKGDVASLLHNINEMIDTTQDVVENTNNVILATEKLLVALALLAIVLTVVALGTGGYKLIAAIVRASRKRSGKTAHALQANGLPSLQPTSTTP